MNPLNLSPADLIANAKSLHGLYIQVLTQFIEQLYKYYRHRKGLSQDVIHDIEQMVKKKLVYKRRQLFVRHTQLKESNPLDDFFSYRQINLQALQKKSELSNEIKSSDVPSQDTSKLLDSDDEFNLENLVPEDEFNLKQQTLDDDENLYAPEGEGLLLKPKRDQKQSKEISKASLEGQSSQIPSEILYTQSQDQSKSPSPSDKQNDEESPSIKLKAIAVGVFASSQIKRVARQQRTTLQLQKVFIKTEQGIEIYLGRVDIQAAKISDKKTVLKAKKEEAD